MVRVKVVFQLGHVVHHDPALVAPVQQLIRMMLGGQVLPKTGRGGPHREAVLQRTRVHCVTLVIDQRVLHQLAGRAQPFAANVTVSGLVLASVTQHLSQRKHRLVALRTVPRFWMFSLNMVDDHFLGAEYFFTKRTNILLRLVIVHIPRVVGQLLLAVEQVSAFRAGVLRVLYIMGFQTGQGSKIFEAIIELAQIVRIVAGSGGKAFVEIVLFGVIVVRLLVVAELTIRVKLLKA